MANAIDGIGTINVSQIVTQLMSVETGQQNKLKAQQSTQTGILTAYKTLNTGFKNILTAAESIIGSALAPKAWSNFAVTASTTSVTGSATSTALAGTYSFDVTQLASAQKSLYGGVITNLTDVAVTASVAQPLVLTAGGSTFTLKADDGTMSLTDLVSAINSSGANVKASAINVGNGYRLQLVGTKTGADNTFSLSGADLTPLGAAAPLSTASNAIIRIGPELTDVVTSSTNTFSNVFPGVTFTASKVEQGAPPTGTAVTLTVSDNSAGMTKQVQDLVDAMNSALNTMKSQTSYDVGTKKAGPLLGDSLPSRLAQSLTDAVMDVPNSGTMKVTGIELTKEGTLKFDAAAFANLLQSDPDKAKTLVTDFAGRVASAAKAATEYGTGSITTAITSRQSRIDMISKSIAAWDDKLALMQARYTKQFAALNTALSKMNDQASWLAGQLNSLSSSSS